MLLAVLVSPAGNGQVLRKRHPDWKECPDTHLRLTARHSDGSPAAGLRKQDLYLWFSTGAAGIRSMQSGEPAKAAAAERGATPETNVLIVARPQAALDAGAADAVLRNLRAAANFQWKLAVLAPDGSMTEFTAGADEAALRAVLTHVATWNAPSDDIAAWTTAERNAFRQLQARSGRHVLVELGSSNQTADRDTNGDAFAGDHTLDLLARDDMAQIYLQTPAKERAEATGGRTAPTLEALFHDIVADAPGSYDLMIHPLFSCEPGASYSLSIQSFRPEVQLYYPSAIRMAKSASR
jgi:hypothetical protein